MTCFSPVYRNRGGNKERGVSHAKTHQGTAHTPRAAVRRRTPPYAALPKKLPKKETNTNTNTHNNNKKLTSGRIVMTKKDQAIQHDLQTVQNHIEKQVIKHPTPS
jgi:hypothetical protein